MEPSLVAKSALVKPKKLSPRLQAKKQTEKKVVKPKSPKKPIVWTEARKKSFIVSVLRSGTRRWPPKYECLADAYVGQLVNKKTGRLCKHYRCAITGGVFPASEVSVDHIEPCITEEGFTTWDSFIERLFCDKENLQVLSKEAHDKKSKQEREARKLYSQK